MLNRLKRRTVLDVACAPCLASRAQSLNGRTIQAVGYGAASIRSVCAAGLVFTAVAWSARTSWALTRTCGSDAVANTANVLCASPSGPCNATSVTLGASIDVTSGGCDFDVGGRTVTIAKTLQMTALGFITIRNASQITITVTGKLKARGDFVEPNGYIIPGGVIQLSASGTISNNGVLDVSGDPAGLIRFVSTSGDIMLQSGSITQGNGTTTFVSDRDRVSDGGVIDASALGGSITIADVVNVTGTQHGSGGDVLLLAARNVGINGAIDASGGESDGGTINIDAGDDITITKSLSVDSRGGGGFGGEIFLSAGEELTGNAAIGGSLTINNTSLQLSGSSLDGFGGDGGELFASAAGLLRLTGANVAIRANAGTNYDGSGGSIVLDTTDGNDSAIGLLDGDIAVEAGTIVAQSGDTAGIGGNVEMHAGKALALGGTITATGHEGGGTVQGDAGGAISVSGVVSVQASAATGGGGAVEFDSGLAQDAALNVLRNIVAASGANSPDLPSVVLASCSLTVSTGVTIDARTGGLGSSVNPVIQLISRHPMQLNANSQYLAATRGVTQTIHPFGQNPVIGSGVTFNPGRSDQIIAKGPYPACLAATVTPTPASTPTPTPTRTP